MTVTYDYAGKRVLVTGGTRGLGAGIAHAFAAAGADVVICARNPAPASSGVPLPTGAAGGRIRFVRADVRDADDVERLFDGLDRLDVVVNNAGGSPYANVAESSARLHRRVLELNLLAPCSSRGARTRCSPRAAAA